MPAALIDGKRIAEQIRTEVRRDHETLRRERGITAGLAFVLVGGQPASESYVRSKEKACRELGFHSVTERRPADSTTASLLELIARLNADPALHGILVQLPLPEQCDEQRIIEAIDYRKDVDGFHPVNCGRLVIGLDCLKPCTPAGIQELLVRSGNDPGGRHVVVVGRSNIVGKPVMNMLLQKQPGANAIVTIAHTGAKDLAAIVRQGDIVIVAAGKPGAVTGEMLKPGCVVIDVGINRVPDPAAPGGTRIVGDVDFPSASRVASAISPVPGGVGPMTIAMLMRNTLRAAEGRVYAGATGS
jgi:methylenetetrahydrofolate dehydrogenase (NADP+)/methenyltetrahydrofolate cyclohydrolase